MAEIQNRDTNGTSNAANAKRHKRFWSNAFRRSPNHTDENKAEQQPKRKGFMNSIMNNARGAATKEVMHVAEHEAMKQVKGQLDNNDNGSQPADANTTTANVEPDTSSVTAATPSNILSAPANWAKRMADSAQQKVQSLQNLGS